MASTANKDRSFLKYSETPPHVHFFRRLAKTAIHFLVKKTLVNTAKFFGPLVTVLTGFYCIKRTDSFCRCKFEWLSAVYKSEGSAHERSVNMKPKVK